MKEIKNKFNIMWNKIQNNLKIKVKCSKSFKIFPVSLRTWAAIMTLWTAHNNFSCELTYFSCECTYLSCEWTYYFLASAHTFLASVHTFLESAHTRGTASNAKHLWSDICYPASTSIMAIKFCLSISSNLQKSSSLLLTITDSTFRNDPAARWPSHTIQ
jgi:hypothetical protein